MKKLVLLILFPLFLLSCEKEVNGDLVFNVENTDNKKGIQIEYIYNGNKENEYCEYVGKGYVLRNVKTGDKLYIKGSSDYNINITVVLNHEELYNKTGFKLVELDIEL